MMQEDKRTFFDWLRILPQIKTNTIPPMIHPLSKGWHQPKTSLIKIDNEYASMPQSTFKALLEYSSSQPSGVYEGKMWKSHRILYKGVNGHKTRINHWRLHWFGYSVNINMCSNNSREIIII